MRLPLFFIVLLLFNCLTQAQNWIIEEVGKLPFKTSNNAVTLAYEKGQPLIYSFCGIDSTLDYGGIHLKAGSVNINTGESIQYGDVPDTLGKIAAGASTVKNKIYIIGGYHVLANGSEISSNKVHCFHVENEKWEADRTNIPIAIDDHVQAVWQDSLIYVITGWSDTKNVPNVQIYNPDSDLWSEGTSVPNNNQYTAFGASGTIIGNTIYYLGGASMGTNFPSTFRLRIGNINPQNPTQIAWRDSLLTISDKYYRAACTSVSGFPTWLGGSSMTYNYNGLSYATNTAVQPSNQSLLLLNSALSLRITNNNLPMDLRGIGELNSTMKVIAGGMYANREVSNRVIKLTWGYPVGIENIDQQKITVYPNPTRTGILYLSKKCDVKVYSLTGQLMYKEKTDQINTRKWASGLYTLLIQNDDRQLVSKIIVAGSL
ncbi:MAG: hypothetical protein COA58_08630 [Bacteroidetes bacterium]|nr:MAG: hypothetical protein COA58_08630 [Bacteroidota bacterium]